MSSFDSISQVIG